VLKASSICLTVVVGMPLVQGMLFNCAVVIRRGRILEWLEDHLPGYREFYSAPVRAGAYSPVDRSSLLGRDDIPFGNRLLFQ
jgi:hypothetical protein